MAECKDCGKKIIWAITENEAKMPLDAEMPVYRLIEHAGGRTECVKATGHYISHFKTCPGASKFSKGKN